MRFKGLDLNLLVVLDALLSERGLTAAARSINLTKFMWVGGCGASPLK
ncbi:hypothetical protein X727_33650 [Mesorhizobium sp. L103C119B0]|nr:hypothetical protein X773_31875 [Mesorhizobium sp. LSJC285A00]ESX08454.1 hypothetical protein X768_22185 [Mesorhizobium sp. LSJC265A00]ESX29507.1 hypothetical protein X765_14930 [Mesorhizobium sp. LSHC440B00]ESX43313.1 hypothetical protein X764_08700 [Mesorhizobium sp. LSHC440A00]ESY46326.1 hypothetical protein X745_31195 [Mesorhizobium sp. LNJC374B00]ESY47344.1 hypothetical protein X744_32560 [Mesorhizobium sp. LNJC372A00]ESZ53873.1 hypothetical protein X727_33650 [Mesorhizobium sp. L103C